MAARMWWHGMIVVILSNFCSTTSVFDHILDDVQPCKDTCDKTYPLHTYPTAKHLDCCKRGCRFFSLVEFINNGQKVNATKDACMASCMEAYSQTGDRYACNIGCASQVPFAEQKQKKMKMDPSSMHMLTPFMFVHNIYNNMVDHMSRIMSVSWSFYLQQDDGKVVVLQSEPEIITEYLDMDEVDYDKNQDESNDSVDDAAKDGDTHLQLSPGSHSLPDSYQYKANHELPGYATKGETLAAAYSDDSFSSDWLGCVARKSGLPRWMIGLTILCSALAMIWLCCTTTVTAPDHHIRAQVKKLSIFGDLEYLRCHNAQEKMPIQPLREDEAPPLPVKIHLQKV